jgi:hypothetical protein
MDITKEKNETKKKTEKERVSSNRKKEMKKKIKRLSPISITRIAM